MSRCLLKIHAEDLSGNVSSGAVLTFFAFGTTTPLTQSLYKQATGSATYSPSEKVTDGNGDFQAWTTTGERMSVIATKSGEIVTTTEESTWDPADLTSLLFSAGVRGAVADGVKVTDAAMTATSNLLTSATAGFTAADVGKVVHVYVEGTSVEPSGVTVAGTAFASISAGRGGFRIGIDEGKEIAIPQAGVAGATHITRIQSIADSDTCTLETAAATAVIYAQGVSATVYPYFLRSAIVQYVSPTQVRLANASLRTISSATLVYGTDQAVAIQSALSAAHAAGGGSVEFPGVPSDIYMTSQLTMYSGVHLTGRATLHRIPSFDPTYNTAYALPDNSALFHSTVALSDVLIRDLTIDNDRSNGYGFLAPIGCERVTIDSVRWVGNGAFVFVAFTNDTAAAHIVANSAMNKFITIRDSYFEGTVARNGGSFNINNPQRCRFQNNTLEYCLSLDFSMSQDAVENARDVHVTGNQCHLVAPTWLFITTGANVAATSASQRFENIVVANNVWRDCGWYAGKGVISVSKDAKSGTTIADLVFSNNVIKTWSNKDGGSALEIGDGTAQLERLSITGNVLDGTLASGTLQVWADGPAIGIQKCIGLICSDNIIRNCGGAAISLLRVLDGVVLGNDIAYAAQATGSAPLGSINLWMNNQNVKVQGNTILNTGNGNWIHDGISVQDWDNVGYPAEGINQDIQVLGNSTYEDRAGASAATRYGISVGGATTTTTALMPLNVKVIGNTTRWPAAGNRGVLGTNVKDTTSAIGTIGVMIFPQYQQGAANTLTPFVLGAVQDRRIVAYDNWGDSHPTIDEVFCQVALPASEHARFFMPSTDVPGTYELTVQVKNAGTFAINRYLVIIPAANANPVVSASLGSAALTLTAPTLTAVAVCQLDVLNNDATAVELLVTGRSVRRGSI